MKIRVLSFALFSLFQTPPPPPFSKSWLRAYVNGVQKKSVIVDGMPQVCKHSVAYEADL